MEMKTLLTAFMTLFLAEMGDKTQLAVIMLTASSKKPISVFIGAMVALAVVTAMGVLFGQGAVKLVPEGVLQRIAGTVFIGMGILMWLRP